MCNTDIKKEIKGAGLYLWQVGFELGLNDGNFSRKLRKELSEEEKARIRFIIEELKVQEEGVDA